jgi:3D-(3,5/4)-trihydroxycyclohexane-1,2-dione acylhydrolase (decyclizing)
LPLVADARATLTALGELLHGWRVAPEWEMRATEEAEWWTGEIRRLVSLPPEPGSPPSQASIIGAINDAAGERGVVVCAAGSAPGDLHKLWSSTDTRAWATRFPAGSASNSRRPTGRCSCWSVTART